jgi:hypothetical protein
VAQDARIIKLSAAWAYRRRFYAFTRATEFDDKLAEKNAGADQ